jgi:hypothetical protein
MPGHQTIGRCHRRRRRPEPIRQGQGLETSSTRIGSTEGRQPKGLRRTMPGDEPRTLTWRPTPSAAAPTPRARETMAADQPNPGPPSFASPTSSRIWLSAPAPTTDSPTGAPVRWGAGSSNRSASPSLPPQRGLGDQPLRWTSGPRGAVLAKDIPWDPLSARPTTVVGSGASARFTTPVAGNGTARPGAIPGPLLRMSPNSVRPPTRSTAAWATPKRDPGARCRPRARARTARSAAALPRFGMAQAARSHPIRDRSVASGSDELFRCEKLDLNSDSGLGVLVRRRSAPKSVRIESETAVRIFSETRVRFRRNPQRRAVTNSSMAAAPFRRLNGRRV